MQEENDKVDSGEKEDYKLSFGNQSKYEPE